MSKSNLLHAIIGILAGFIIGFVFANKAGMGQPEAVRSQAAREANTSVATSGAQPSAGNSNSTGDSDSGSSRTVSEQEIRDAIAKADQRADDLALQRNFGTALYRYANQTQNSSFLPDVARMLKRAQAAAPQDRDLTVMLGNVLFDIGQTSDPTRFAEAREYYLKALEMKQDDANVRTDLGLTYFFGRPSDPQRAIIEYRKSLALDPQHQPTLQNLATALITQGKIDEAQKLVEQLGSLNPQNPALPDLRAQLAQSRNRTP